MGEIGIDRREFLYEIHFWEARRIIRGYNARHHYGWEQARLIAYNARFCMGVPKGEVAPTLTQWIKFSWEKEPISPLSDEERKELQEIMDAVDMK